MHSRLDFRASATKFENRMCMLVRIAQKYGPIMMLTTNCFFMNCIYVCVYKNQIIKQKSNVTYKSHCNQVQSSLLFRNFQVNFPSVS